MDWPPPSPRRPRWGCEDDVLELGRRFDRYAPSRFYVWWTDQAHVQQRMPIVKSSAASSVVSR